MSCAFQAEPESSSIKPYGVEVVSYDPNENYMALMMSCAEEGQKLSCAWCDFRGTEEYEDFDVGSNEEQTCFFDCFDAPKIKEKSELTTEKTVEEEEEQEVIYYSEEEVVMVAKAFCRECGGVPSITERACVAWTICNRVGADGFQDTIKELLNIQAICVHCRHSCYR